jgi:hypothetical protein
MSGANIVLRYVLPVFLCGGAGYLLRVPLPPSGSGQYRESPDGKWVASASTLDERPVLGPRRTYYEFAVQAAPRSSPAVRSMTVQESGSEPIDWRQDGSITWATNAAGVTFGYDGERASLRITMRIAP